MENKIIGIGGLLFLLIFAVSYALHVVYVEGVWILNFIGIPTFVIVIAFGGLTLAKKEKYEFHELGNIIKHDLILVGWIATVIGLILTFTGANNGWINNTETILHPISASFVSVFYGYLFGNIIESCWPNRIIKGINNG